MEKEKLADLIINKIEVLDILSSLASLSGGDEDYKKIILSREESFKEELLKKSLLENFNQSELNELFEAAYEFSPSILPKLITLLISEEANARGDDWMASIDEEWDDLIKEGEEEPDPEPA